VGWAAACQRRHRRGREASDTAREGEDGDRAAASMLPRARRAQGRDGWGLRGGVEVPAGRRRA
jgi:hypothetical protein